MKARLSFVAEATGGSLAGADPALDGVSIDSRTLAAGQLFIAIRGERYDGHDFARAAAERGAAALLVARPLPVSLPQVVVADTVAALAALAGAWRARFDIPVVAVAGSNGKTTTKEMLARILATAGDVLATRGNLNNHIGVPLTLLRLAPGHRHAVIELGANHPGEVAALTGIARPDIAVVTNAGDEHLEGFGNLEGVAQAEGEVFAGLPADGTAVINAEDPFADMWRAQSVGSRIVSFGIDAQVDVGARALRGRVEAGAFATEFELLLDGEARPARIGFAGRHNVSNALAAAAAAHAAGIGADGIVAGLAAATPVGGRLQLKAGLGGSWLIDDSYNANPSSVRAGIDVLCGLPGEHWLVLGEMAELGPQTDGCHAGIGDYARRAGIARLYALGAPARHAVSSFGTRGGRWFADAAELADEVAAGLGPGVTVLIKGSRVNRLERVVARLLAPVDAAGNAG